MHFSESLELHFYFKLFDFQVCEIGIFKQPAFYEDILSLLWLRYVAQSGKTKRLSNTDPLDPFSFIL